MNKRDKYDIHSESRISLSEKFAGYYGNLRGLLLGSHLAGRRATYQESPFSEEAQLTAFKKEKDGGKEDWSKLKDVADDNEKFKMKRSEIRYKFRSKDVDQLVPRPDKRRSSGCITSQCDHKDGQIKPKSVDFLRHSNRQAHRTSDYEIPNLIIRRGQQFDLSITFDRPFSCKHDDVVLKFVTGRRPLQSKGTVVPVHKREALKGLEWGYQLVRAEDKIVHLKVCTSPDAIVGRYNLFIETTHRNDQGDIEKTRYAQPDDIYILFNPWCPEDQVYVEEETHREEYVLNETGRIWLGTVGKFCVRPWNYGQFDDVCLVAAIAIMEKSELGDQARGNAVHVLRALSKVINNNERDGGVLIGNWSGRYDDGVAPYAWNGSPAILEEFLKKRKGVKYGQCWTFAAVATTVFRALGIPTRCVTCFKAAHDSDYSSEMDCHWSTDGKPKTSLDDAVWDFHVWNESWCNRPDLPPNLSGWQAYDPTPQECVEGVFTCGPASVNAVKNGELFYGYDTKFLFAEVNGDRVHWTVDPEGNMTPIGMEEKMMGRYISTKAVSTISREDLTYNYKHPEGSEESAVSLELAKRLSTRRVLTLEEPTAEDVSFSFSADMQRTGDFTVYLTAKNTGTESRLVDVHVSTLACRYTGIPSADIKDTSSAIVLEPNKETSVSLSMKCADFISNVDPDCHVTVYAIATVKETGQIFLREEPLWIEKPHIELKTEGSAHIGKPFDVVIKLVNPLTVPLSGGHINIEGPGMQRLQTIKVKKSIAPGEELRELVQVKPRRLGRKEIIANFHCKQLCDVTGVTEVDIIDDARTS